MLNGIPVFFLWLDMNLITMPTEYARSGLVLVRKISFPTTVFGNDDGYPPRQYLSPK